MVGKQCDDPLPVSITDTGIHPLPTKGEVAPALIHSSTVLLLLARRRSHQSKSTSIHPSHPIHNVWGSSTGVCWNSNCSKKEIQSSLLRWGSWPHQAQSTIQLTTSQWNLSKHSPGGIGEQSSFRTAWSGCGCGSLFISYKATKTFIDPHHKQEDPFLTTGSFEGDC